MSTMRHRSNFISEKLTAAFSQPDPSISHKFFEIYRRKAPLQPEKRLMLAVLEDAILCLRGKGLGRASNKNLSRDAVRWILEQDGDWIFSFENVCEALGLSPASAREHLLGRRRRDRLCG